MPVLCKPRLKNQKEIPIFVSKQVSGDFSKWIGGGKPRCLLWRKIFYNNLFVIVLAKWMERWSSLDLLSSTPIMSI